MYSIVVTLRQKSQMVLISIRLGGMWQTQVFAGHSLVFDFFSSFRLLFSGFFFMNYVFFHSHSPLILTSQCFCRFAQSWRMQTVILVFLMCTCFCSSGNSKTKKKFFLFVFRRIHFSISWYIVLWYHFLHQSSVFKWNDKEIKEQKPPQREPCLFWSLVNTATTEQFYQLICFCWRPLRLKMLSYEQK